MPADSHMKIFYILIKLVVAFHVNKRQQLHLPINSIIDKREKKPSKIFQPIWYRQQHYQLNFQTKEKLDWSLKINFCNVKMNFPILFSCSAAFITQNIPLEFLSGKLNKTETIVCFNFDPNSCTNVRKRK